MTTGERLYEMRKAKGLSQEAAANILGVTRQTVSKWETDQSTPDFDKIIPICDLYGISSEELLRSDYRAERSENSFDEHFNDYDENSVYKTDENFDNEYKKNSQRKKSAALMAAAIALYILSVTPFLVIKSETAVVVFFIILAAATMLIVYSSLSKPKDNKEDEDNNKSIIKRISSILSGIVLVIYLVLSFLTHGWAYTWIIWIVYSIVIEIIKLAYVLKEDKNEKQ